MWGLPAKFLRLAAGLALAIPTLGCTPARILNALITEQGYHVERDVAYADSARHKLDIYVPDNLTSAASVAVFFYGGRWEYGSKADYVFIGQALASKGIIAVIADYRLYPETRFPGFIEDGAKAVSWVARHIAGHGGDPDQIYVIGHSAGAHLAAMLAMNSRFLEAEDIRLEDLRGMIGLAGPYDFLPIKDPVVKEVFAVNELEATQPINHVNSQVPSILLLTGGSDETVLPRNSLRLGDAISDVGGDVDVKVYDRIGHVGIVLALATPFRWLAPTLDDIVAFIARTDRLD